MMNMRIWAASICLGVALAAAVPVIDPTLKTSYPTVVNISKVDSSLSTYDRIVLLVDGNPFFYNGVQLRIDKLASGWKMTDAQIAPLFKLAVDTGFTVVNVQILWSNIQPDSVYNATETTYIRGGTYKDVNYAAEESMHIGYTSGDESNQELTYLKFNFTAYSQSQIDAAKVRVYVNAAPTGIFSANLYGIANNSWSSSKLTWSNAPSHNGVQLSGKNNTDYWLSSSSPSWDPIHEVSYYDFDASDFITNHCPDRIASFIFQSQVNDTSLTNAATLDGAKGAAPPQLFVSSTSSWDWSYIDKVLGWAEAASIKLEFVWFGSDSTSTTADGRVPYWVFRHPLVEKIQSDGTVVPVMLKNQGGGYGVYWYLADKNDLTLRAFEKKAIKALMNHVYTYNKANGNKKTLIGFDVANENSVTHIKGVGSTVWQNPATWGAFANFSSVSAWIARTEWEYTVNLANGVKESKYPVWTRCNTFTTAEDKNIVYNEQMRASTGTSLDFVGLDPYSTSTSVLYSYGHQQTVVGGSNVDWSQGSNLPMVMENSGAVSNAEWLVLAALAGGAFYNVYELIGPDNFGPYYAAGPSSGNFTPVARGTYVANLIATNKLLKSLALDLASKRPSGANGTELVYFNPLNNGTLLTGSLLDFPITYSPGTGGVGIVTVRGNTVVLLASTRSGTFEIDDIVSYGIKDVEYGYYNTAGSFVANGTYPYTTSGTKVAINMSQGVLVHVNTKQAFR